MKKMKLYARHGDVFIFKTNKLSSTNLKKQRQILLALGEVTGHSHKLEMVNGGDISYLENGDDSYSFELTKEGFLTHEEHDTIKLPPGQYISIIQTEYDPINNIKKVID
jgi:predicted phosphodiesterase